MLNAIVAMILVCSVIFACGLIFMALWKLNCGLYNMLLKIPAFVLRFIGLPFAWFVLSIRELIRHPSNIYYLFRAILILPVGIIWGIFSALFGIKITEEKNDLTLSQSSKHHRASKGLPVPKNS